MTKHSVEMGAARVIACVILNIWYYYSLVEANWYPPIHFMSGDKNPIAAMFIESDMSYGEHKML